MRKYTLKANQTKSFFWITPYQSPEHVRRSWCLNKLMFITTVDISKTIQLTDNADICAYCCRGEVAGIRTCALRISVSQTLYQLS